MEHALRCNDMKCRAELRERALVTTCRQADLSGHFGRICQHWTNISPSHIFCLDCGSRTGLIGAAPDRRVCPACQTHLPRPDDAINTILNPSEDYKTSVLSGLCPEAIMECAGRGLSFWSYQMVQDLFVAPPYGPPVDICPGGQADKHELLAPGKVIVVKS